MGDLRFPTIVAAAAVLALCLAGLAAAEAPSAALPIEELRLDNGMRFLLLPRPAMPTVEAGWVVDIGAATEEPGGSGLAHLVEHMMFKGSGGIGSRDRPRERQILARIDALSRELAGLGERRRDRRRRKELAAEKTELEREAAALVQLGAFGLEYSRAGATRLDANTGLDFTLYYVTLPWEKLELWFWLESERLRDPVFRELEKERRVVAEERRLRVAATPTGAADEAFDAAFWRSTPYAVPTLGRPQDVARAERDALIDFFRRHYRPRRLVAALVGNFDPASVHRLAERYFGRLDAPGPDAAIEPLEPWRREEEALHLACPCPSQVRIRYPTVPFGHRDEAALQLLAGLLNGRGGRLYQRLVLGREIAFAAYARQIPLKRAGAFSVTLEAKGGLALDELVAAWDTEVAELVARPPSLDELRRTQRRLATEHLDQLKDPHFLLRRLLVYAGLGDWRRLAGWTDRIAAVEPRAIHRTARQYLVAERRLVAFYEPDGGK